MKALLFALYLAASAASLCAQPPAWPPSPNHPQLPLWPGLPPDAQPSTGPEIAITTGKDSLVAGRPWIAVENVSQPTMTVYSPTAPNTGAAVVVFPGGGYSVLAIDLEGTEVCDWLVRRGITCILLKYRVPGEKMYPAPTYPKSGPYPESPIALEDAQRTIGLIRLHAAQWHIDPHKIGVLGFSAGGHLVAAISNYYDHRVYPLVDAADHQSCRPDFAIAIYPGHLAMSAAQWDASQVSPKFPVPNPDHLSPDQQSLALNPYLRITRQTPPTFLLQNEDDDVDGVNQSLAYYIALLHSGVPVEMHLYAQGGHAFGLRQTKFPTTAWPALVDTWLHTIGVLPQ